MCPADLAQRLDVFLTDAVRLSGRNASVVLLLSPLALWEHTWSECINPFIIYLCCTDLHEGFSSQIIFPRGDETDVCSTPVLLQGGEVGEQAFVVELLQLQELDGPLVW